MQRLWQKAEWILVLLVVASILWKGGKALDATWILAGCSALLIALEAYCGGVWSPAVTRPVWWTVLLFSGWTIVSFLFSQAATHGFDEILQTVSLSLVLLFSARLAKRNPGFPSFLTQAISFAFLIACAIGIAVYVFQPVNRFVGTFFDYRFHTDYWPNAWAEFVLLAWPLLVWVLWTRKQIRFQGHISPDVTCAAVAGLGVGCMLLSYSRGGLIAFAGQLVLLAVAVCFFLRGSLPWKRLGVSVGMAALVSVGIFLGVNAVRSHFHPVQSVVAKATLSSDEGASSVIERKQFWSQALIMTRLRPWFGFGPYSFRFIQPEVQADVLATSDHPHNIFLKLASERGVASAAFFLLLLLFVTASAFRVIVTSPKEKLPLELFLFISLAGVVAHNLVDYNLQFVGVALPLWMIFGILLSTQKSRVCVRTSKWVEVFLAFALFVSAFLEGVFLVRSSVARHLAIRGKEFEALTWYARTDYSVFPRDAWLSRGSVLLHLSQMPEAESAVNASLSLSPQDGRAWRLLGDIYLEWDKKQDALRAYEKAYAFNKYNDIGITRGLVSLLGQVDRNALIKRRHEFDEVINEFGYAIENNVHFIALGGNVEELKSLADLMARYFPQDAALYRALARRSMEHAKEERVKFEARPVGLLW